MQTLCTDVRSFLDLINADELFGTHSPGEPKKHCPFCTGFAAFKVYTAAAAMFIPPQPSVASAKLAFNDERSLRKVAPTPQSRGPPSLPA